MSSLRFLPPFIAASLAASLGACSARGPAEDTAQGSSAIWGGSVDSNDARANVVVQLDDGKSGCSGTLVTPQIVLTAAHCIDSFSAVWNVSIGADSGVLRPLFTSHKFISYPGVAGFKADNSIAGQDFALLVLDAPVVTQAIVARQKFVVGSGGASMAGYSPFNHDWTVNPTNQRYRTIATVHSVGDLGHGTDDSGPGWHWFNRSDTFGLQHNDSGGPLFYTDADGSRQVLGVASSMRCTTAFCDPDRDADQFYWGDVTNGAVANWVQSNLLDTAQGGHTARWYASHNRDSATYRFGELDVTGPCDTEHDRDCDGWLNANDNCPDVANSMQEDSKDNGVGDACRLAISSTPTCTASSAEDGVRIACDPYPTPSGISGPETPVLVLERQTASGWIAVTSPDLPRPYNATYTYRAHYRNLEGDGPATTMTARPGMPECWQADIACANGDGPTAASLEALCLQYGGNSSINLAECGGSCYAARTACEEGHPWQSFDRDCQAGGGGPIDPSTCRLNPWEPDECRGARENSADGYCSIARTLAVKCAAKGGHVDVSHCVDNGSGCAYNSRGQIVCY